MLPVPADDDDNEQHREVVLHLPPSTPSPLSSFPVVDDMSEVGNAKETAVSHPEHAATGEGSGESEARQLANKEFSELTCTAIALIVLAIGIIVVAAVTRSPKIALFALLQLSPVIWLIRWGSRYGNVCRLSKMVYYWSSGFWIFGALAWILEIPITNIFFFFVLSFDCVTDGTCGFFYTVLSSFLWIGLIEELWIYIFAAKNDTWCRGSAPPRDSKAALIYSTSFAVGFSNATSMFWMTSMTSLLESLDNRGYFELSSGTLFLFQLLIAIVCMVLILPMHVLSAYYMSTKRALQRYSPQQNGGCFSVMGLPWLVRGSLACITAWPTVYALLKVSWILFIIILFISYIIVLSLFAYQIKRLERRLPVEYRQRVGQLSFLGYGLLPGDEPHSTEAVAQGVSALS